jgi:iron complex transport system permease protein
MNVVQDTVDLVPHRSATALAWWLLLALAVGGLIGVCVGVDGLHWLGADDPFIITAIRLPRVIGAVLTGALLGLAGALAQGLFRNPLADPYLLGSASGATLALVVMIALTTGVSLSDTPALALLLKLGFTGAAFAGAMGGVALTLILARGAHHATNLLLAGVIIGILLGTIANLITLSFPESLRTVQGFLYGSTSLLSWSACAVEAVGLSITLSAALRFSRVLDALVLGESTAESLGVEIHRTRLMLILLMALATGCAVAQTGLVAFVGLISPHLVRRHVDTTHQGILLLATLTGAVLLLWADTLSRWWLAPSELPVGLFTAILGGGYLLWLLYRQERGELA